MYWIRFRPNEPIPKELYYDGWQGEINENEQTPLMLWIEYRREEAIPQELYYP